MSAVSKKTLSKEGQILLASLQKAVTENLEKKRRLGQYAVIWQDGKPVVLGGDVQNNTESEG
jgi:hypothetical protein